MRANHCSAALRLRLFVRMFHFVEFVETLLVTLHFLGTVLLLELLLL